MIIGINIHILISTLFETDRRRLLEGERKQTKVFEREEKFSAAGSFGCGRPADGGAVASRGGGGGLESSRGEIPRRRNLLQAFVVVLAELAQAHRRVYHRLIGRLDAVLFRLRQLIGPLPRLERVGEIPLHATAVRPLLLHSGEELGGVVAGVKFPQLLLSGG